MFQAERHAAEAKIRAYCVEHKLPDDLEYVWAPIPFGGEWGISTSFFQLAAQVSRTIKAETGKAVSVPELAQDIAQGVAEYLGTPLGFMRVEAQRGYLNLYFATADYARRVIDNVLIHQADFGRSESNGNRILVEFSQPNTHKAFHVGHLRNVVLGDAICNILDTAGYDVIRANYINDTGLHTIKWLWNYQRYHAGEEPGKDKTRWMGDLYAEANQRIEASPEAEKEVRTLYARWDQRDPEVIALWEETRQWSLDGFDQIYDLLGIRFDHIFYDHEMEKPGQELVQSLIAQGIAEDERPDGPVIIRLDDLLGLKKEKYRVLVVLRSDGTSLYATKDLALSLAKFAKFNPQRSVYVIDVRQSLYLQQIFKTLEIMGHPEWAERCFHMSYEIVNLPGNVTIASREGTVVLLEDLIREAKDRALKVVQEKNPSLSADEMEAVARAVALGAIKYPMLSRDSTRVVTFDWESALDFNGQAAPYIQYASVRGSSILRRATEALPGSTLPAYSLEPAEIELIDLISRVPGEIERSAQEFKPLLVATLAYELARAFNDFYMQCPVIQAPDEQRSFRLRLVAAARQVLNNLLTILGIPAPEVM